MFFVQLHEETLISHTFYKMLIHLTGEGILAHKDLNFPLRVLTIFRFPLRVLTIFRFPLATTFGG